MNTIYLDNNATTRVAPEVYEAIIPYLTEDYFNPSSMYEKARSAAQTVTDSRKQVAGFFGGVDPSQIIFTSCATDSNNAAIYGTAKTRPNRKHIITTVVEHPAVLEVCKDLMRGGYEVDFIKVDSHGNLNMSEFVRALRPDTLMVTVMHANNETGVVFPIEELSRVTKETDPSIVFHTDATQTVTKLSIDLKDNFKHVDLLSFSGHKIHAPKGVGVLYLKKGTPCRPFLIGGHQEAGRRAGTENVAFIAGLAKALELGSKDNDAVEAHIARLRERLEKGILETIPEVRINGIGAPRLPNTSNISCHYVEGEGILYQLSSEGICASSGSACTSGSLEPSHVLKAMDVPFTAAHGSIRFSLSRYNNDEEIDRILKVFPQIIASLRKLSPYWDNQKNQPRAEAGSNTP